MSQSPDPERTEVPSHPAHHGSDTALAPVALAALGVVYGDLGTSPLYTLKECFNETHGVPLNPHNVLGIISLIFWSLTIVISFMRWNAYYPDQIGFTGIDNFKTVLSDPDARHSIFVYPQPRKRDDRRNRRRRNDERDRPASSAAVRHGEALR